MSKKPVLLCIMDGFGWTPNETYGNAVVAAKKPFLDSLMAKYPMTTIFSASGTAMEGLQSLTCCGSVTEKTLPFSYTLLT